MTLVDINSVSLSAPSAVSLPICEETRADVSGREALLDAAFGPARFRKTCERLRAGRRPAQGLSLIVRDRDAVVGTLRMWHVAAGDVPALMLGPLAVAQSHRSLGLGGRLVREALARAAARGHGAVLLVGDAPYYAQFGFQRALTARLAMPGPVESDRFLGLDLIPGSLAGAEGLVCATGALELRRPRRADLLPRVA